jgi:hypothetical protein
MNTDFLDLFSNRKVGGLSPQRVGRAVTRVHCGSGSGEDVTHGGVLPTCGARVLRVTGAHQR